VGKIGALVGVSWAEFDRVFGGEEEEGEESRRRLFWEKRR
jgi:hypothetical protein